MAARHVALPKLASLPFAAIPSACGGDGAPALRDGKVFRTNHTPMDRQAMSGYEEAALVRGR